MTVLEVVSRLQEAAKGDAAGDAVAHMNLLREIHNLRLVAETPAEKLMRTRLQIFENLCIRLTLEYGLLQAIAAKDGEKVTAKELSNETGTDELLIVRLMRLVTYDGICAEVAHATYAANDTTRLIAQKGFVGAEKVVNEFGFHTGSKMIGLARHNGVHQFPQGEQKSPFEHAFGKKFWEHITQDEEAKEAFNEYMASRRDPTAPQWYDIYSADTELTNLREDPDAVLLVDVGGGVGHEVSKFRERFAHLPGKVVLQDLPETVDGVAPEGVTVVAHNFFDEQPIKGARMYYLRAIMHDWPDEKNRAILSRLVDAMDKDYSSVLIDDYVLSDTGVEARPAALDFIMMAHCSGIERTRSQWENLLGSVGLEIKKVWSRATGLESVIEARARK